MTKAKTTTRQPRLKKGDRISRLARLPADLDRRFRGVLIFQDTSINHGIVEAIEMYTAACENAENSGEPFPLYDDEQGVRSE